MLSNIKKPHTVSNQIWAATSGKKVMIFEATEVTPVVLSGQSACKALGTRKTSDPSIDIIVWAQFVLLKLITGSWKQDCSLRIFFSPFHCVTTKTWKKVGNVPKVVLMLQLNNAPKHSVRFPWYFDCSFSFLFHNNSL